MSRRSNGAVQLCSRVAACCLEYGTQWRPNLSCATTCLQARLELHGSVQQGMHGSTQATTSRGSIQTALSETARGLFSLAAAAGPHHQLQSHRAYSEGELRIVHADVTENDYHHLADEALDKLQEKLEAFIEDLDVAGGDVEQAQGVLTVKLGSLGTYVINKQTPNRQIWLSSPLTGPFRYDYHAGQWVYMRTGQELFAQLQGELQQLLGSAPDLTT